MFAGSPDGGAGGAGTNPATGGFSGTHAGGDAGAGMGGASSNGGKAASSSGGRSAGGAANAGAGGASGAGGSDARGGSTADASAGDAQGPADGAVSNDAGDGAVRHKRLFITRDRWDGNLLAAARPLDGTVTTGIAAADVLCNRAAATAGIGGFWVAWLSDGTHDAIDRVRDVGPWYRVDGAEVFADKAALAGNPLVAIDLDETGADTELIPDGGGGLANVPWTGTVANGTRSTDTCDDWGSNSNAAHGLAGANTSTTNAKWSEATAPLCDHPYHLYCFEQ